ncbi:hypothetical protein HDV03_004463 [Kappamyces sp. JEL0829]|nr:hypothetical protein HDV03_004463 [Kappamyces sp. JEL0829]
MSTGFGDIKTLFEYSVTVFAAITCLISFASSIYFAVQWKRFAPNSIVLFLLCFLGWIYIAIDYQWSMLDKKSLEYIIPKTTINIVSMALFIYVCILKKLTLLAELHFVVPVWYQPPFLGGILVLAIPAYTSYFMVRTVDYQGLLSPQASADWGKVLAITYPMWWVAIILVEWFCNFSIVILLWRQATTKVQRTGNTTIFTELVVLFKSESHLSKHFVRSLVFVCVCTASDVFFAACFTPKAGTTEDSVRRFKCFNILATCGLYLHFISAALFFYLVRRLLQDIIRVKKQTH